MEGLTAEQVSFFNSEGYLVLENFASEEECNILIKKMAELVEEFDPSTISIFSTKNQRQLTDDYFYESANKISFFFEEKAFTDDGNLKQSKSLSINKVGHALHDLEPNFHKFSYSPRFSAVLSSLGYKKPVLMQSMYIFKQPGIGGEVVPHQDNSFLYTDPTSCIGLWVALEAANIENGCLWVLPASHKGGLRRRLFRDGIGGVTFDKPSPDYDLSKFVPLEAKTGTLVVIHGDLVHQSFENKSSKSRHAFSLHAVETDSCNWASDNWLVKKTPAVPLYTK